MSLISEKVAYLRGVAEGMASDGAEPNKLISIIIDVLESVSEEIDDLNNGQDELFDHIFDIEDALEIQVQDEHEHEEEELEDFIGEYIVECPKCKEEIILNEEDISDEEREIKCEKCGAEIVLEFDRDEDEDEESEDE